VRLAENQRILGGGLLHDLVLTKRAYNLFAFDTGVSRDDQEMVWPCRHHLPFGKHDFDAAEAIGVGALAEERNRLTFGHAPVDYVVKTVVPGSKPPLVLGSPLVA